MADITIPESVPSEPTNLRFIANSGPVVKTKHTKAISSLSFSPNGEMLLSGGMYLQSRRRSRETITYHSCEYQETMAGSSSGTPVAAPPNKKFT